MAARIERTVSPRPTKIASPTCIADVELGDSGSAEIVSAVA